jgi:SAM-dependent methyltransferase
VAFSAPGDPGPEQEFFTYVECADCGTLWLPEPPSEIGRYYSGAYYSFNSRPLPGGIKGKIKGLRDRLSVLGLGPFTSLVDHFSVNTELVRLRPLFDGSLAKRFKASARILAVGCGDGRLLKQLRAAGFTDLTGVDPFLSEPVHADGLRLLNTTLDKVQGSFDVVIMYHSLEHMNDPRGVLAQLRSRLAPGGMAQIRIPLARCWAWEEYGPTWVQMDPPRHFTLFSPAGFQRAAERTGWLVSDVHFDSTRFQITGSILKGRGVNIHADYTALDTAFNADEQRQYDEFSQRLNIEKRGDQAAFFLV